MLHHLMFAFASLLAQDGAPPAVAPPAPVPTVPAPLPVTTPVKASHSTTAAKPVATTVKKDAKPLVIPSPKVKEPEVPSYRVSVVMPGNRRFTGVVTRDKLFSDLVRLNAHNTQEVYRRPENFTLRFVDGVDGDVTLRWNQIQKLDVRAILDAAGLRTIEEDYHRLMIVKKEQEEAALARQQAEDEKARALADASKPAGDQPEEKKSKPEELPPLLAEFRPDEGWTPKRKEQIEWRQTVLGTAPDKTEQRFLDVYPQWLETFNAWQASPTAKPADAPKGDPAKDDAKKDDAKKDDPKSDDTKKDEVKKDDAKKDEPKKDEAKKDGAPKDPTPAPEPKDGGGGAR